MKFPQKMVGILVSLCPRDFARYFPTLGHQENDPKGKPLEFLTLALRAQEGQPRLLLLLHASVVEWGLRSALQYSV